MISSDTISARAGGGIGFVPLLLLFALLWMGGAAPALACLQYGGVVDGNVNPVPPSQIQIDAHCTIRNFPAANPLTTNFSFFTQPGQTDERWLIVFDNVVHTGNMACNSVAGHKIWFTNGSSSTIQANCQNLLIPVEKIDKRNPAGQATAAIGVPFTYRLTIPILHDPATGTTIDFSGSPNELHGVTVVDDLNATGAALTYMSHRAFWLDDDTEVPHTFVNAGGVLTFDNFPIIPAGRQFVIDITVVLQDTPANVPGTQFVNTARWDFGRLIDDVFYEPLPGEWGVTPPMTIVAPSLVVDKTGTAVLGGTTLNLGEWGEFTVDVWNNGSGDAWNVTLLDRLPQGPTGGMCDLTPEVLSVTLAGMPLAQGTGYSLAYTGAPACQLTLTLLEAAGPIPPNERLILTYRTKLDADTQNGATLTNVAGATRWFNADSSVTDRQTHTRTLTDGTVGTLDHEDAHTVAVALSGYFFEKTVANLRSGQNPATVAAPGDRVRYTLRLQTTEDPLNNFAFYDELDALNTPAAFAAGTLALASALPAGAVNNSSSTGGAQGTGVISVSNLNLPAWSQLLIQFEITVAGAVAEGSMVANQAQLLVDGAPFTVSDDPYVNGQADPYVVGDEDPTRFLIRTPTLVFHKTALSGATGQPGDVVRYRLQVGNVSDIPLSAFSLLDDLDGLNDPAMFVPGTLTLVSALPAGATNNSDPHGGSKGTGLIDIRNLSVGAAGAANDTLIVEFTVQLAPVIANGTVVLNQAQLTAFGTQLRRSDDPALGGDQDPTGILIESAPVFRVHKISQYLSGDPNVLLPGETLRYIITVKNIGNDNAADAVIRDQVPVNTAYVAGSTTLNGLAVADSDGGSPLVNGMPINAPGDPTPGLMRADAADTPDNVATITFDVAVDPDVVEGTVLSNQAFVSALAGGVADYPSDDPRTPVLNDPTRDVVGYLPLIYAEKSAALQLDYETPGVIDPGDVLRYTITVYNTGNIAATGVSLRDPVPANTTYVADSLTLNGMPMNDPDGGISPLAAGVHISSTDLTPPLPDVGEGTLSPRSSAVIQFDLRVNDDVPRGTLISNQAVVRSEQLPNVLTDGDGDPATGPEPTVVVVGAGQQLSITKQVAVVGGGVAEAGRQLEYVVRVTNISVVPAYHVVITDDLDMHGAGRLTFVEQSATLNASTTGISIAGSVLTANYSAAYGPLPPGQSAVLRFRATIAANLPFGTTVTNTGVVRWNDPPQTARTSVAIDVGGMPGVGVLSGTVWHDANFNTTAESNERLLEGWSVELLRNDRLVHTVVTNASGTYRISGVVPNYLTEDHYELRFVAPGAGAGTAKLGRAHSIFTNDLQRITEIVVQSGGNLTDLNLPIEPNGVVYNAITRAPVAGATLTMVHAGSQSVLPFSCFYDPDQQNQVTLADGYYRFDINFSDPACPSGASYVIEVTAPTVGYFPGRSQIMPPMSDASTAPFSVPSCPASVNDAIAATALHCEIQVSEFAPSPLVRARSAGTVYHAHLALDDSLVPGSSQIFNNHIPLDPDLQGALAITKTTPSFNVTRGQLVPYVITFTNITAVPLFDVNVVDRFPAGFRYVEGSARLDGVPAEPTVVGRQLVWSDLSVDSSARHTLLLLLAVGAGVSEGEFVNRAQAVHGLTGNALSGEASATVRVVPDPTFDCTDVTGKVFDDANRNGRQDAGERGLPGVRLVSARGLSAITDGHGRFHITCAITPREGRGSNFILKLDDRTLPSGYRASTEQVRVLRATRGKALRFNFGASIHRVISLDISDAVFEPGTTQIRSQWQPRMAMLLNELQKSPAVLRLSYLADREDARLVERRLSTVKNEVMQAWKALDCCYQLAVEPEVFWRLGAPQKQATVRMPQSR